MMCAPGNNAGEALGVHSSRRWKGVVARRTTGDGTNRSTRRVRSMAEGAEDCSPGRAPGARAPLLPSTTPRFFVRPADRSPRRAPRPRSALRALRVSLLPCHVPVVKHMARVRTGRIKNGGLRRMKRMKRMLNPRALGSAARNSIGGPRSRGSDSLKSACSPQPFSTTLTPLIAGSSGLPEGPGSVRSVSSV